MFDQNNAFPSVVGELDLALPDISCLILIIYVYLSFNFDSWNQKEFQMIKENQKAKL